MSLLSLGWRKEVSKKIFFLNEQDRRGRFNYCRAELENFLKLFETANWSSFIEGKNTCDKWECFLRI